MFTVLTKSTPQGQSLWGTFYMSTLQSCKVNVRENDC